MPTVDLHGNLSQGARTRNMAAFHSGKATTLVATDIAARGIHVDDVALVVHADPPTEHKAYLHRSGRTARAGAAGTVITLMTDEQRRDVQSLTRAAGIKPLTTRIDGAGPPDADDPRPRRALAARRPRRTASSRSRAAATVVAAGRTAVDGRPAPSGQRSGQRGGQPKARSGGGSRAVPPVAASRAGRGGHSAASFSSGR